MFRQINWIKYLYLRTTLTKRVKFYNLEQFYILDDSEHYTKMSNNKGRTTTD